MRILIVSVRWFESLSVCIHFAAVVLEVCRAARFDLQREEICSVDRLLFGLLVLGRIVGV